MSDDYITLDTNFSIQSGFAFPSSAFVDEGIPIVRMSDLKTGSLKFENTKYVSSNWLDIASLFRLKEGDFVLGMSGSLSNHAKVTINDVPALLNQRVGRLVSKNLSNSYEYASYWLKSEFYQHYADIQGEGAAQKNISPKKIGAFKIRNVDKPTQDKIVYFLATVDRTIEKTEALIAKYQLIKAGLMQDLFTRGIGADGKLRPTREQAPELYQETQIGWIPRDWEATKLKDILLRTGGYLQTGPFGSQLHAHEYTDEGVPVVMPQDIDYGFVHETQIARITEFRAQSLIRHRLKVGDIIIARRGELSRAAAITEIEKGWICGTGCFLMRLGGTGLNSKFISQAYRHPMVQRQVEGLAVGSTMPSLNNSIMGKLIFPDIDQTEQSEITRIIELAEDKVTTLQAKRRKLELQKQGLMHDLLTGKKRVTVDEGEAEYV